MKVQLTMEFDIPEKFYRDDEEDKDIPQDKLEKYHLAFAKDEIFRQFVNFAICQHLVSSLKWVGQDKQYMVDYHKQWADIIREAEKTMKIKIPDYIKLQQFQKNFDEMLSKMTDEELRKEFEALGYKFDYAPN